MRFLGIDYGKKKIGVALSDETNTLAYIEQSIRLENDANLLEHMTKLIDMNNIGHIVIGLPLRNGEETEYCLEIKSFAQDLFDHIANSLNRELSIDFIDESFSTKQTKTGKVKRDKLGKVKKIDNFDDNLSARIILQDFLNNIS